MKSKYLLLLLLTAWIGMSCNKNGSDITISLAGTIRDDVSMQPLAGIQMFATAVSANDGTFESLAGKSEAAGQCVSDANGNYKMKMHIFKGAARIDFDINAAGINDDYVYSQQTINLTELTGQADNNHVFILSPTALLTISYRNASPASDSDFFYFNCWPPGNGWTKGIISKQTCGTVVESEAATWRGKDVCGSETLQTTAGRKTGISWNVTKNGIYTIHTDSVFINKGIMNTYAINY